MEDFTVLTIVTLFQREKDLNEYLPHHIFSDKVFVYFTLFNELRHITILAVLHDYIYPLRLLINYSK